MKKIPNTLINRMKDEWSCATGWDPASPEERQAWIDGKMTDEEFIALCEKSTKKYVNGVLIN